MTTMVCVTLFLMAMANVIYGLSLASIENTDRNDDELFWVSINLDVFTDLSQSDLAKTLVIEYTQTIGNGVLIGLAMSSLSTLIYEVHQNKWVHQDGGFVTHRNKEAGIQYLEHLELGDQSHFNAPNIDNGDVAKNLKQSVQNTRMLKFGKKLLRKFKTRYALLKEGADASEWIKAQLEKVCSSRSDIEVESVSNTISGQKSIVVTIQGSEGDDIVILGAHLDSISDVLWNDDTQTGYTESKVSPGADDDASGIMVLMEALRVIIETGYKPKKTVKIMAYGAEEVGLVGSGQIASEYSNDGKNVVGVLNFDMVGYQGLFNFGLSKDYSNFDHSGFVATLIEEYLSDLTYLFVTCGYACSDHASWYENDIPATSVGEVAHPKNPNYHTEGDTIKTLDRDYMGNFAKLAVIYLAELAKGTVA